MACGGQVDVHDQEGHEQPRTQIVHWSYQRHAADGVQEIRILPSDPKKNPGDNLQREENVQQTNIRYLLQWI